LLEFLSESFVFEWLWFVNLLLLIFSAFFNVWLEICRPGRNLPGVELGELAFLFPLPFLIVLKKQIDFLLLIKREIQYSVVFVDVARVTDGERRLGRLLDRDLEQERFDWGQTKSIDGIIYLDRLEDDVDDDDDEWERDELKW